MHTKFILLQGLLLSVGAIGKQLPTNNLDEGSQRYLKSQGRSKRSKRHERSKCGSKRSKLPKGGGALCVDVPVIKEEEALAVSDFKAETFSGIQFGYAQLFASGQISQTSLSFSTDNFLWYVWELAEEKIAPLQDELPANFELAKISVSQGEEPKFYIVLNIYNVVIGGSPAIRAEWSTFVNNGSEPDTPYFMILDAPTNGVAVEPTKCRLADSVPLVYDVIQNNVGMNLQARGGRLISNFTIPCFESENSFAVAMEFQAASEKNYWLSGVYDRGYYSGALVATSPIVLIDTGDNGFALTDDTYWATFYKSETPEHVFYYLDPIDFVLNPWYNLDSPDLDPSLSACLNEFKYDATIGFVGLSFLNAIGVSEGTDEALLTHEHLGSTVPTLYINFYIKGKHAKSLEKLLPEGYELAKTKMISSQEEKLMMTMRLSNGGIKYSSYYGTNAEIITYVRCKSNPNEVYQMILETISDYERSQPEASNLILAPGVANFSEIESGLKISALFINADSTFELLYDKTKADVPKNEEVELPWLVTHDRQYYLNGVYDYYICDKSLFDMQITSLDLAGIDTALFTNKWLFYAEEEPFQILSVQQDVGCIVRPWFNL